MSTLPASPVPLQEPAGLRGLARRHPIVLYLTIVFGLGYPLMLLPVLADCGIIPGASLPALVGLDLERAAALMMVLLALFPAALIVSGLEGGRPAVAALLRRMLIWRIGVGWWALVLLVLPTLTIALAVAMGDTLRQPTVAILRNELVGIAVGFLLVNLWEGASWAGFLQTRLERRHNLYLAAALTAVPFAAIHMPLQLLTGTPSPAELAAHFLLLSVLGILIRSYLGLVMRSARDSLLAVGIAHTMFNRSINNDGIAATLLDGGNRSAAALLATPVVTILIGVVARGRSGVAERARLEA
ncbi:MAG: CPBP family glutamic-type intramembrane protease [Gemmatimonadales bacterium]